VADFFCRSTTTRRLEYDRKFYTEGLRTVEKSNTSVLVWCVAVFFIAVFLLYAPLLASLIESSLFGTAIIYDMFDSIGLADPLEKVYGPTVEFFERLF